MTDNANRPPDRPKASLWIDHNQAVIMNQEPGSTEHSVEVLIHESPEPEPAFLARVVDEVIHDARVIVHGPGEVRTAFERTYVAVTHEPEHLVDVAPGQHRDGQA
jgi:hypothetical protein